MLPEYGHLFLIIALLLAAGIGFLPALPNAMRPAVISRFWTFLLLVLCSSAYIFLTIAFLSSDFSVLYAAENSSLNLPWWYKICAVWGGHEGSILLWIVVLCVWMTAVALFSRHLPEDILVKILAVLGWIAFGFLLFLLATSNPFERLLPDIPANGRDLNPLLQDIGFLFHPPVLYMGYVGFSVPFALSAAALWCGRWDADWAAWSRPWALAAWCFLTTGITLGSWWAYRELGWGGWWFWDPVENASFMPWILGTALIHSLVVTQKRNTFKAWTALLSIGAFSLSLLGTFLVRSGILTSVHAFAVDPKRGLFMLVFLLLVMGISLTVYAWRAAYLRSDESASLLSRETFLMLNNVMLASIMLTILLGTLYPLIIEVLGLGKLSVGAPYFNTVFSLLMLPVLFIMGLGPLTFWKSMPLSTLEERTRLALLLGLTLGLLLPWLIFKTFHWAAALGVFLAVWIFITTCFSMKYKRHWGMFFAHCGIAACLVGITISSSYSIEKNVLMSIADQVNLGPYSLLFKRLDTIKGPNYSGIAGVFELKDKGKPIGEIRPEKRYYPIQRTVMTDAAINANLFRDIYIAIGESVKQKHHSEAWMVRLYYKPMIRWIWGGGFLILLGGIIACLQQWRFLRRYFLH